MVRPASRAARGTTPPSTGPDASSVAQGLGARAVAQGQRPAAFPDGRKTVAAQ